MNESLRPDTLSELLRAGSAMTGTVLVGRGIRGVFLNGVRRISGSARFAGPAMTVRFLPIREDLATESYLRGPSYPQRAAADQATEGSVIVYAVGSPSTVATAGEMIVNRLAVRRAAALVTDGLVRDSVPLGHSSLPVFASGVGPAGHTIAHMAVDFGSSVACGGVHIQPGDVLVGDEDGVVCIPRATVEDVAAAAYERMELEAGNVVRLRAGASLAEVYAPSVERTATSQSAGSIAPGKE